MEEEQRENAFGIVVGEANAKQKGDELILYDREIERDVLFWGGRKKFSVVHCKSLVHVEI